MHAFTHVEEGERAVTSEEGPTKVHARIMGKHACNGTGVPFLYYTYVRTLQQKQLMNAAAGFRETGKASGGRGGRALPLSRPVLSCPVQCTHGGGEGQVRSIDLPPCTLHTSTQRGGASTDISNVRHAVSPAARCACAAHGRAKGIGKRCGAPHDHRLSALIHACMLPPACCAPAKLLTACQRVYRTAPHRTELQKKTSREESANSSQIGYTDPVRKAQKRGVPGI